MWMVMASVLLSGCGGGGGLWTMNWPYGASWDRHNFLSTPHRPLTILLEDTVTKDVVWKLDIPVNKMAVVDFEHEVDWTPGLQPAMPAYVVYWSIVDPGAKVGTMDHEQKLNGNPVLMRMVIRKPGEDAADIPVAQPATEPDTGPAPKLDEQPVPTKTPDVVPTKQPKQPAEDVEPDSVEPKPAPPKNKLGGTDAP